ncbi:2-hydroxycarboxylate transporter family protein [Latilactobacillus curvatus]|uniref:2-hydroxycarboxylate transporter family protein n=1 Tax=Latilactobacillus curvatus TaxID=28038 RepID=UPI001C007166|nr:2-hydroxycarboxylate transporter family protein [Latilactobacillus curvatus]MBZ1503990.1 2-hydroxycarboxylate transporter family protein [Latilactobacillus curvatus]MCP8861208.1 2-hydroxycarboxylate transporter family protein [Latilactobacillus curvatus]MCP8867940.1 2-hydroxycarboxylate transporter family protein [Latilactobacillus curvatus]MCP8871481.1 2-hydroxycarboxylate transporter family protein [Latilactobacillus curvatus]MCP8880501.1 2-hydroxycarboxylate transporter family protein [L
MEAKKTINNQNLFQKFIALHIGIIPMPLYLILALGYILLTMNNQMPNDMLGALGVMTLFSFILEEIGKHIPVLKSLGGKVLVVTFLPSYLVYQNWLPKSTVHVVTDFMTRNNFLAFFIALLIVGSISAMNRKTLIKASTRIIVVLLICELVGPLLGIAVGTLLGLSAWKSYFYVVAPIMAGGVGEGALPLSLGYAAIISMTQPKIFAMILPCVMLGSLVAVILAGILKKIGDVHPELTGNGRLVDTDEAESGLDNLTQKTSGADIEKMLVSGILAVALYLLGVWVNSVIHLPAPIVLLIVVMAAKMLGWIPESLQAGGSSLYSLTVKGITPPLLFGVGVAMTPWNSLITVFTNVPMLITIVVTVTGIVTAAFFSAKLLGMYPVDTAIAVSCCSGQGGTGALAILAAGDRMVLMPFAQVAVRLGGAITVTLSIFLMRLFA